MKTTEVKTECRDCIFFETNKCSLGRLEKFDKNGLVVWDNTPVIQTVCNAKRDQEWADDTINPEQTVLEQIRVVPDFIILSHNHSDPGAQLMQSAKQCIKQTLKPKKIIFVTRTATIPNLQELYFDLHHILDNEGIKFHFITIVDYKTREECIDEAYKKVESFYYTIWETGKNIPTDFNESLNRAINDDMRKISMIKGKELHGLTIQSAIHKIFNGNKNGYLVDKIIEASQQQNLQSMVIEYEKL